MPRTRLLLACVLVLFAVGVLIGGSARATTREQWVNESCMTNGCIAGLLNSLPPERAAEAKLTTWHNVTYVWYRK